MDTVRIQLKHANAKKLLKDLEDMDIIKMLDEPSQKDKQLKPSELRGFLSKDKAEAFLSHVKKTRTEWTERLPGK